MACRVGGLAGEAQLRGQPRGADVAQRWRDDSGWGVAREGGAARVCWIVLLGAFASPLSENADNLFEHLRATNAHKLAALDFAVRPSSL